MRLRRERFCRQCVPAMEYEPLPSSNARSSTPEDKRRMGKPRAGLALPLRQRMPGIEIRPRGKLSPRSIHQLHVLAKSRRVDARA